MVLFPQQQNSGNLMNAMSMWNQFAQPGATTAGTPDGQIGAGAPVGTYYDPNKGTANAPGTLSNPYSSVGDSLVPKAPAWNDPNSPWFGTPGQISKGSVQQPPPSSGNLGKAAGALGGLSGILGSI